MDIDKLLRDSARVVNTPSLRQRANIDQLEERIHTRVMKPAKRRQPLFYVAVPLCLLIAITLLFPQGKGLVEQTMKLSSQASNKEPALPSLHFTDKESLLNKITLENVTVAPPYVKVTVDLDLKEHYWASLEEPYLVDEMGRKYLFVNKEEVVRDEKYVYTFISQKKFEAPPEAMSIHIPYVFVKKKMVPQDVQQFALTLNEKYPKTVSLDHLQLMIHSFTYSKDTLTLVVSSPQMRIGSLWLQPDFATYDDRRERIGTDKVSYRYVVSKQDSYSFHVSPVSPTLPEKVLNDLQIAFPIND
ncbi:hypothetical protein [Brevibacillus migulae]|uniref:hypothetical protein n=1 Tax=Brevibacillus migulae TaxID=1644114 RepID=UPI00106E83CA|nr:hypothetical protein [Brevibacillus migulae]